MEVRKIKKKQEVRRKIEKSSFLPLSSKNLKNIKNQRENLRTLAS
jgi:hypothetical protein